MDLLITAAESDASPASELLDAIIASGRVPDPMDSRELPAHLERARRRVAEKHPPSSAASDSLPAKDGAAPPKWRSVLATVLLLALTFEVGVLLGVLAVTFQWLRALISLVGWL